MGHGGEGGNDDEEGEERNRGHVYTWMYSHIVTVVTVVGDIVVVVFNR